MRTAKPPLRRAGGQGPATADLHASMVALFGRGVLIQGASAAGKSALTARLLVAGAWLVADDVVRVTRCGDALHGAARRMAGLIELRGSGIFQLATMVTQAVTLCVELQPDGERERLPVRRSRSLLGIELPLLLLDARDAAAEARIMIALAARRVD